MATIKYVIPGGTAFQMAGSANFFAWLTASGIDLSTISPGHRVIITHAKGWSLKGAWLDGTVTGDLPLTLPDQYVRDWLNEFFGPKSGPMDDHRELIESLQKERQAAADATARAEELRAEILRIATERGLTVVTLDGVPVLQKNTIFDKSKTDYPTMKRAYPDLFEQYTSYSDEFRLEFVK